MVESTTMFCHIHGDTTFRKHKNGNASPRFRCSKCSADAVAKTVKSKQDRAYDKYGHSCKICGYSRCRKALEWHHINPIEKEIEPSKVFSRSWGRIVEELDKCILLCSNCHREVHDGLVAVPTEP